MSTLNKPFLPTTSETSVMTMIPMLTLMNPSSFPLNSVAGSWATSANMMFRSAVVILMMMSAILSGLLMTPTTEGMVQKPRVLLTP